MTDVMLADMGEIKLTDTAQLRRLFGTINSLLKDGYNHKQICEYLNSTGIEIPYPQYRAIMTRLRRENNVRQHNEPSIYLPVERGGNVSQRGMSEEKLFIGTGNDGGLVDNNHAPSHGLSWDPGSKVKWK